jgi:hypothetical protein
MRGASPDHILMLDFITIKIGVCGINSKMLNYSIIRILRSRKFAMQYKLIQNCSNFPNLGQQLIYVQQNVYVSIA